MGINEKSQLIKIDKTKIGAGNINSVNSRDIYNYLQISEQYVDWIKRVIEKYDFIENEDYITFSEKSEKIGRPRKDYIVTMDMAKELCMISNTLKGREVRKYFIKAEEELNKPKSVIELLEDSIAQLKRVGKENLTLANIIEEQKPKVNLANAIIGTTSNIDFETFAKALYDNEGIKLGRNKLMAWFRDNKYLTLTNKPYQTMLDRGLMCLKEGSYINNSTGELVTYTQARLTGRGQLYFTNKLLEEKDKKI